MSDYQLNAAARIWNMGGDTVEIAAALLLPEARVYNHLRFIRDIAAELKNRIT